MTAPESEDIEDFCLPGLAGKCLFHARHSSTVFSTWSLNRLGQKSARICKCECILCITLSYLEGTWSKECEGTGDFIV